LKPWDCGDKPTPFLFHRRCVHPLTPPWGPLFTSPDGWREACRFFEPLKPVQIVSGGKAPRQQWRPARKRLKPQLADRAGGPRACGVHPPDSAADRNSVGIAAKTFKCVKLRKASSPCLSGARPQTRPLQTHVPSVPSAQRKRKMSFFLPGPKSGGFPEDALHFPTDPENIPTLRYLIRFRAAGWTTLYIRR
jgi:hypothetical protein